VPRTGPPAIAGLTVIRIQLWRHRSTGSPEKSRQLRSSSTISSLTLRGWEDFLAERVLNEA
jgi:hypothetical protein